MFTLVAFDRISTQNMFCMWDCDVNDIQMAMMDIRKYHRKSLLSRFVRMNRDAKVVFLL
ncbi:hypothetical protein JG688_00017465 [Phytophthora aleatoria]|uniref:Uncharacterized protein n=1 Tax=Phytophthora aleatoria TaxID=2496075 RepID=A0A8J5LVB3_9STRA|nr:hypothetical protein JG688_00017465 [Phytophthora aleatoria]